MPLTYVIDTVDSVVSSTSIVSGTLTIVPTSVITAVFAAEDNAGFGTLSISNSGTALTWHAIAVTNTVSNTKVAAWWAFGDANGNRTVTITHSNTAGARRLHSIVHAGAHQTTPVPAGNIFSGVSGSNISQSITPTATGSALWMMIGDWAASNSYVARASCTLESTHNVVGHYTATLVRPTTQPMTGSGAFTIGVTDTGATDAWVAFEVVAAVSVTFVLGDPVLDNGLGWLNTNCDNIYICAASPVSYADATSGANSLGSKVWGVGNAFGADAAKAGGGRQITSTAITDGNVTTSGTVAAWAAVDSVNSALLAYGNLTGGKAVTSGQGFTLSAMTIGVPNQ